MGTVRDDFRCSLCRQKNAFHCEHDTPYRDQLLGTYEQTSNNRRNTRRTGSHVSNGTSTMHTNSKGQHGRISEDGTVRHVTIDPAAYTYQRTSYGQKKKKTTCVIL